MWCGVFCCGAGVFGLGYVVGIVGVGLMRILCVVL